MHGLALLLAQVLAADSLTGVQDAQDLSRVLTARRDAAKQLVGNWIAEPAGQSRWALLGDVKRTYQDLRIIVHRPSSLDQADYGGCGPVALLAIFFTYFPTMMARFTRDLLLSGAGRLGDLLVPASAEMMAVTKGDLPHGMIYVEGRRMVVPEPLTWMLMVVLQYAITKSEADVAGLNTGAGTEPETRADFLKTTGLAKDVTFERFRFFDLDNTRLVTKKAHPLREILFGVDGDILDDFPSKVPTPGQHVIWLKDYAHVGAEVDLTYYTWGQFYTKQYDDQKFKAAATAFTTLTMKIDAAD